MDKTQGCKLSRTSMELVKDWYLDNLKEWNHDKLIGSLLQDLEKCGSDDAITLSKRYADRK